MLFALSMLLITVVSSASSSLVNFSNVSSASLSLNTNLAGTIFVPIPIVIQYYSYTCGAASSAALLQGLGYNVTEESMMKEMHSNDEVGTLYREIVAAFRRRNLNVETREFMDITDVQKVLLSGGVVMVTYQAWKGWPDGTAQPYPSDWQDGHYSVVIGFDEVNIYLMDPSQYDGLYGFIPIEEFKGRWHDIDGTDQHGVPIVHFGIIIYPSNTAGKRLLRQSYIPPNTEYTM